jgi:hypothetical protein
MPVCRVWLPHPTIQILCPWFEPRQLLSIIFRRAPALPLTLDLWNELASAHSIANSYQSRTGLFYKRLVIIRLLSAIPGCYPATNTIRANRGPLSYSEDFPPGSLRVTINEVIDQGRNVFFSFARISYSRNVFP